MLKKSIKIKKIKNKLKYKINQRKKNENNKRCNREFFGLITNFL